MNFVYDVYSLALEALRSLAQCKWCIASSGQASSRLRRWRSANNSSAREASGEVASVVDSVHDAHTPTDMDDDRIWDRFQRRRRRRGRAELILVAAALVCSLAGANGDAAHNACAFAANMDSNLIVSFFESNRPAAGCISNEITDSGLNIHVVRVNATTGTNVLVTMAGKELSAKGTVLILESESHVGWRLAFVGQINSSPKFQRIFVTSSGSSIVSTNLGATSQVSLSSLGLDAGSEGRRFSNEELASVVRSRWGALTTFTQVSGANRISIMLQGSASPPSCSVADPVLTSPSFRDAVNAYLVTKQPVHGCLLPNRAGKGRSDVHIFEVQATDGVSEPRAIYLSLAPEKQRQNMLNRDLTLVLVGDAPFKWFFQSSGLVGNLTVISDPSQSVHNMSLGVHQSLNIVRRELPQGDPEALWRQVSTETGSIPISYASLKRVNIVSMLVAEKSSEGDRSGVKPSGGKTVLSPEGALDNILDREEAEISAIVFMKDALRASMTKSCSQTDTVLALRRAVVDKYKVAQMTLNDPNCLAQTNETHWVLKTTSTSCGSLNLFSGKSPMFRNNIVLAFAPASRFFEEHVEIPFTCRFRPGLPGADDAEDEYQDYDDVDGGENADDEDYHDRAGGVANGVSSAIEEMYGMVIRLRGQALLSSRGDSGVEVAVGEEITVETHFETRSFLHLALERCWLSANPDDDESMTDFDENSALIWKGCPLRHSNVSLRGDRASNPSFAFRLTENLIVSRNLYVFCLIGLCSPVENMAAGNLGLCVDPSRQCQAQVPSGQQHQPPVALQLSRRGPLRVKQGKSHPQPLELENKVPSGVRTQGQEPVEDAASDEVGSREAPGLHSSHVVMVGVPAEIAVAIALASFVIGAALTGTLCCVHHKNASQKEMRARARGRCDGSELQAMMTSASAQQHNNNNAAQDVPI